MSNVRSPNYPAIDLATALALSGKIYEKAQRHSLPVTSVIVDLWQYKLGSYASQCAAALRSFGLVTWEGMGGSRKIGVTPEAAKILDGHADRADLLRKAALLPRIHGVIWSNYESLGSLPPDETLRQYLVHEHEPAFNRGKVDGFIKQFRQTLSFAGIDGSDILTDELEEDADETGDGNDGRQAGPANRASNRPKDPAMKEDVFTLDAGDAVLRWPASMSQDDFDDFEAWLHIVKRKALRAISKPPADSGSDSGVE